MKRWAWVVALFGVGVMAGFGLDTSAPAMCAVGVDLSEGSVVVYTSGSCPADPQESFTYSKWVAKVPVCLKFAVVTTGDAPRVVHPCNEGQPK